MDEIAQEEKLKSPGRHLEELQNRDSREDEESGKQRESRD